MSRRAAARPAPPPALPAGLRSPFVRPGARERQRTETRERLYAAALDEFRAVGFERANVADIARAAGVSRPSFYAHFPTLDHVLFELTWRLSLRIVGRLEGATRLRDTLDRLAEALIEAERAVADPGLFREMISVFARRPASPGIDASAIPVLGELMRRFERARREGELRAGMEPERAARLCLSAVFGHLLGVEAPAAERRADLRALFSLFVGREARPARNVAR